MNGNSTSNIVEDESEPHLGRRIPAATSRNGNEHQQSTSVTKIHSNSYRGIGSYAGGLTGMGKWSHAAE